MKHITQTDIAKRLNVTRITVSKALRDHPDISQDMKHKVRAVAEELGYIPNLIAQNLTLKKTFTLGIVIPDLENSFFAYLIDSIIDTASQMNFTTLITVSRENKTFEKENIQKLIGMRVDGLLVCVTQHTDDTAIFKHIEKLNIPLVFFDRTLTDLDFPSVTFDDRNGAINALAEIIKHGYTRFAHIAGYQHTNIGRERSEGFNIALKRHGLDIDPNWIIEGGMEVKDGYNAFMQMYNSNHLPEIIFAVNDRTALGVYQAANKVGVHIPNDIGLVAYGFNQVAQTFTPPLTVIDQNPRKLGAAATNLLIDLIENDNSVASGDIRFYEEFLWNSSILKKESQHE